MGSLCQKIHDEWTKSIIVPKSTKIRETNKVVQLSGEWKKSIIVPIYKMRV